MGIWETGTKSNMHVLTSPHSSHHAVRQIKAHVSKPQYICRGTLFSDRSWLLDKVFLQIHLLDHLLPVAWSHRALATVSLSLQVPYQKGSSHQISAQGHLSPKMKKKEESSLGMLKAHQIICGFFHPKLSRLRHQYSGTEHISFRTPCSTEQNGVCSRMDDCKWIME